jgi:hypothetical protein
VQGVVDLVGQNRSDPRDRAEHLLGLQGAAQALELHPATAVDHLADRRGDRSADPGQGDQALEPIAREHRGQVLLVGRRGLGGAPVGADPERVRALLLEQIGKLAQLVGDLLVGRLGHLPTLRARHGVKAGRLGPAAPELLNRRGSVSPP